MESTATFGPGQLAHHIAPFAVPYWPPDFQSLGKPATTIISSLALGARRIAGSNLAELSGLNAARPYKVREVGSRILSAHDYGCL